MKMKTNGLRSVKSIISKLFCIKQKYKQLPRLLMKMKKIVIGLKIKFNRRMT